MIKATPRLHFQTPISLAGSVNSFVSSLPPLVTTRRASTHPAKLMSTMAWMPQYHCIEGVENLEEYKPGGYHPVSLGEILKERYRIVDKLGYGGYSTVWLGRDDIEGRYVALKVVVADCHDPVRESKIVQALSSAAGSTAPAILDEFDVQGPNGTHRVYAMSAARCDLQSAKGLTGIFQLKTARMICGKLIAAVDMLHSKGYVHGGKLSPKQVKVKFDMLTRNTSQDLRDRNVLVMPSCNFDELSIDQFHEQYGMPETIAIERFDGQPLSPHVPKEAVQAMDLGIPEEELELGNTAILLNDFGESFSPSAGESRLGQDSHTPENVRPPECYLNPTAPMSASADIWQLGLALWEIVGITPLTPSMNRGAADIIEWLTGTLGPLPPAWREAWDEMGSKYFEKFGQRVDSAPGLWPSLDVAYEECVEKNRKRRELGIMDEEERKAFLDLVRRMLAYLPEERPSSQEILQSDWVVKWVTPDLEQSIQQTGGLVGAPANVCGDATIVTTTELHESDDSGISLSLDPPMTETSDPHDDSGVAV